MDKETFEKKYLGSLVRSKGKVYYIPITEYLVTAALYEFEDGGVSVFAIKSKEDFFTIKIAPEDFDNAMNDFEIIE